MKEFGSDFHYSPDFFDSETTVSFPALYPDSVYYADGRQALQVLIESQFWKRIWLPEYYCHDVIEAVEDKGIRIAYYKDSPLEENDDRILSKLDFKDGDVLVRVNYFGLRSKRDNSNLPVPVIEDHTHDLTGTWAAKSNADWCIASLRKILPVAEGGVLWSPKGRKLPAAPQQMLCNSYLSARRMSAMLLKNMYLHGENISKDSFRNIFVKTETNFSTLSVSAISEDAYELITKVDLHGWNSKKKENWKILVENFSKKELILTPDKDSECNPFSLILFFENKEKRERVRKYLIGENIYPAVLWPMPETAPSDMQDISDRILSVHCDARYTSEDMLYIKKIIEESLR